VRRTIYMRLISWTLRSGSEQWCPCWLLYQWRRICPLWLWLQSHFTLVISTFSFTVLSITKLIAVTFVIAYEEWYSWLLWSVHDVCDDLDVVEDYAVSYLCIFVMYMMSLMTVTLEVPKFIVSSLNHSHYGLILETVERSHADNRSKLRIIFLQR
jgi:hypothetical protein